MTNVTVSNNSAGSNGGGIYNGLRSELTMTDSTGSGNTAGAEGGGIYNEGVLNITNSTISGDPP